MRVDIIVVTFDPSPSMLEAAVCSLLDHTAIADRNDDEPEVFVHVVDNGRRAAGLLAASTWRERSLESRVKVTTTGKNLGFGGGMNVGIEAARAAGSDVIVLLNDDIEVTSGWLAPLVSALDDPSVGAVQPLLVSADGGSINSAGVTIDRYGAGSDVLRDEPVEAAGTEPTVIDVFTGGAVALARAFVDDVGGFDERFFLYYEDVDLALRGSSSSTAWSYLLEPNSIIEHRGSATTSGLGDQLVLLRERNRLWAAAMHAPPGQIVAAFWLSVRRLRHRPRGTHAEALVHGVVGSLPRLSARMSALWIDRRRSAR